MSQEPEQLPTSEPGDPKQASGWPRERHLRPIDTTACRSEVTWSEALTAFAADLRERGMTPATRTGRLGHVRRFAREHPGGSPTLVRRADLLGFLDRPEWHFRTRKAHRASLVDFFTWASAAGHIASNPAASIPTHPDEESRDQPAAAPCFSAEVVREIASAPEHPARAWARDVGYPHAATGRLSADVLHAWQRAGTPVVRVETDGTAEDRWARALQGFVRSMHARSARPATVSLRRAHVSRFAAYLGGVDLLEVAREDLNAYLSEPTWAPETRRSHRASLSTFFTWAHMESRLIPSNPAYRLKSVRVPAGKPLPASEIAIRDAINGARPDVRLMILLGALAGLRVGEIASLHTSSLLDEDVLRITGKGGTTRVIPIHAVLRGELKAYRSVVGLTIGHFFTPVGSAEPYTPRHVSRLISRRLPAGISAHKLRHRFASRAYAGQYNLRAVQELLGHASPTVTARYVAVPDVAARDAVLAVPPIPGIEAPDSARRLRWTRPQRDELSPDAGTRR